MNKCHTLLTVLIGIASLASAETNALIEVKLFKDWVIKGEEIPHNFNIAIKNTGTDPILLAKEPVYFETGQLAMRPLPHKLDRGLKQEDEYQMIIWGGGEFIRLLSGETHVYVWRKFFLDKRIPFSEEMHFVVSIYLGNGFWLDSEPIMLKGVVPDSEEKVATVGDADFPSDLVAVTYKDER